jgi:DNA-binding MarR family transcriptional regulator
LTRGIEDRVQALGFDLSRPRYSIVRMLYLSPEQAMAQSDIAQALGVSGSNITQLIDALVADGWVEREPSPVDKRVTYASLTEAGKSRASVLVPAVVQYMVESCSSLTKNEQAELRRLVDKVRAIP